MSDVNLHKPDLLEHLLRRINVDDEYAIEKRKKFLEKKIQELTACAANDHMMIVQFQREMAYIDLYLDSSK
jgi:hypothetical protein